MHHCEDGYVDHDIVIRKLLDFIFQLILTLVFICWWEI